MDPDGPLHDHAALLEQLRTHLDELTRSQQQAHSPEVTDRIYRFWHQSCKVFRLQAHTSQIAGVLRAAGGNRPLNPWFEQLVADGTGHVFHPEDNGRWYETASPVVHSFLHVRHLLDVTVEAATTLEAPTPMLPSGWATVLCLYQLR